MGSNVGHKQGWHVIGQEPAELLWISAEHVESMKGNPWAGKGGIPASWVEPDATKRLVEGDMVVE